jgi:repressor LexA
LHTANLGSIAVCVAASRLQTLPNLTPTQRRILRFVTDDSSRSGVPPTQEEIADHFGYRSLNSVRQHLRLIELKGYIEILHGKARGIRVVLPPPRNDDASPGIPLVGRIAAGEPILAEHNIEAELALSALFGAVGRLFALRVQGDSMTGAGIVDSDIAVLEKTSDVESGEVAAVRLDDDATLKRVIKKSDHLILRAENPNFPDRIVRAGSQSVCQIEGRLVGVIRQCKVSVKRSRRR